MIKAINNNDEFNSIKNEKKELVIFIFHTPTSNKSLSALEIITNIAKKSDTTPIYSIDASIVKDIHPSYGINSVPAVLTLKNGALGKIVYGLQSKESYEQLLNEVPTLSTASSKKEKTKTVIVYTTPTCPHCTTIKNYLNKLQIKYREVNVAADQKAAEQLMKKSGQTGVPQTEINGQIVVGADMTKLNRLLGIEG